MNKNLHLKNTKGGSNRLQGDNYTVHVAGYPNQRNIGKDAEDDWDGEDSLFEKIDLSRIVAESSETSKKNDDEDKTDAVAFKESVEDGVGNTDEISARETGAINNTNVNQNMNLQLEDIGSKWEGNYNKCSVSETVVAVGGNNAHGSVRTHGETGNDDVQYEGHGAQLSRVNVRTRGDTGNDDVEHVLHSAQSSTTPAQEKWFSHIGQANKMQSLTDQQVAGDRTPYQLESNVHATTTEDDNVQRTTISTKPTTPTNRTSNEGNRQIGETPQSALANRLKQRLQRNAKVVTPVQNRAAQLRKASIDVAMSEAIQVQSNVTDKDVGPFYGLPSKVQDLLKVHRGIEQLYGKYANELCVF